MKRFLLTAAFIGVLAFPKCLYCQGIYGVYGIHDAMNKRSSHFESIKKGVSSAVNSRPKREKVSWNEKQQEREEAKRRQTLRNLPDESLLYYIDDSDYKSILNEYGFKNRMIDALSSSKNILDYYKKEDIVKLVSENPSLMMKVKGDLWYYKEKILDYAGNPHLKSIIMSDPRLREYYEMMQVKQDVRCNPRKSLDYAKDPKWEQLFIEDSELKIIYAEEKEKKAKEDYERQIQLAEDEKNEQNRREQEIIKEKNRKEDEKNRAHNQEIKNQEEQEKGKALQKAIMSSPAFAQLPDLSISAPDPSDLKISDPTTFFGINYTDNRSKQNGKGQNKPIQKKQVTAYDDDTEEMLYFEEKLDDIKTWYEAKDYNYKIGKKYEASKEKLSTVIKETPDNARKKVVSIPIDKAKEWVRKTIDIGYPGAHLEEKAEEVTKLAGEEKGFIEGILQSIIDAVDTGDLRRFEECTNQRTKQFDEGNRSRLKRLLKLN